jgi:hypothetical protein
MLTNLRLTDLRLTTAQQRSTGQNLPSDVYLPLLENMRTYEREGLLSPQPAVKLWPS